MNSEIKKALEEFSQVCVPSIVPWEQIRERMDTKKQSTKTNWIARHKKLVSTFVGAAVLSGGVFGGASLSPSIAVALDKLPGVNQIYDWFGDPGLNHAAMFDNKMHVSAVDKGITFTVMDAYYDKGRLALQYQINLPDRMIGVTAAAPDMDFFINGNKVNLSGMGVCGPVSATSWQGIFEVMSVAGLPKEFMLQIAIHKIGNVRGYWQIQVPVSGTSTFEHTKTYAPNASRTANGTTITVNQVTVTPATVLVNFEYTGKQYTEKNPLELKLLCDDGTELRPIEFQVISQHMSGSTITVDAMAMYAAPQVTSKVLKVIPAEITTNQKLPNLEMQIPLN
jgi:hypothetical protein